MPVLQSEQSVYPDFLFQNTEEHDTAELVGEERRWHVMHTRPRQEKCLARQLLDGQVPFYLPLVSRRFRIRGRTVTSHVPLFAGYVFVLADELERLTALATRRIVQPLVVKDQDGLWRDLRRIEQLIASGAPITPEDRLGPGAKVRIRSGPLAGLEGTILRTSSGRRLVVQVNFIQRGASVLLDDFAVVEMN